MNAELEKLLDVLKMDRDELSDFMELEVKPSEVNGVKVEYAKIIIEEIILGR